MLPLSPCPPRGPGARPRRLARLLAAFSFAIAACVQFAGCGQVAGRGQRFGRSRCASGLSGRRKQTPRACHTAAQLVSRGGAWRILHGRGREALRRRRARGDDPPRRPRVAGGAACGPGRCRLRRVQRRQCAAGSGSTSPGRGRDGADANQPALDHGASSLRDSLVRRHQKHHAGNVEFPRLLGLSARKSRSRTCGSFPTPATW